MDADDSLINLSIVPAAPGYFTVYDLDDDFAVCEPIVAWRVETRKLGSSGHMHSDTFAVTTDGEPGSNCVGTQGPDGRVYLFSTGESFDSVAELSKERKGSPA